MTDPFERFLESRLADWGERHRSGSRALTLTEAIDTLLDLRAAYREQALLDRAETDR